MGGTNPKTWCFQIEKEIFIRQKSNHTWNLLSRCKNAQAKKPTDLEKTLGKAHACMMLLSTRKHSNPKTGNRKTCDTFGFF
jgi:hypothetical protein